MSFPPPGYFHNQMHRGFAPPRMPYAPYNQHRYFHPREGPYHRNHVRKRHHLDDIYYPNYDVDCNGYTRRQGTWTPRYESPNISCTRLQNTSRSNIPTKLETKSGNSHKGKEDLYEKIILPKDNVKKSDNSSTLPKEDDKDKVMERKPSGESCQDCPSNQTQCNIKKEGALLTKTEPDKSCHDTKKLEEKPITLKQCHVDKQPVSTNSSNSEALKSKSKLQSDNEKKETGLENVESTSSVSKELDDYKYEESVTKSDEESLETIEEIFKVVDSCPSESANFKKKEIQINLINPLSANKKTGDLSPGSNSPSTKETNITEKNTGKTDASLEHIHTSQTKSKSNNEIKEEAPKIDNDNIDEIKNEIKEEPKNELMNLVISPDTRSKLIMFKTMFGDPVNSEETNKQSELERFLEWKDLLNGIIKPVKAKENRQVENIKESKSIADKTILKETKSTEDIEQKDMKEFAIRINGQQASDIGEDKRETSISKHQSHLHTTEVAAKEECRVPELSETTQTDKVSEKICSQPKSSKKNPSSPHQNKIPKKDKTCSVLDEFEKFLEDTASTCPLTRRKTIVRSKSVPKDAYLIEYPKRRTMRKTKSNGDLCSSIEASLKPLENKPAKRFSDISENSSGFPSCSDISSVTERDKSVDSDATVDLSRIRRKSSHKRKRCMVLATSDEDEDPKKKLIKSDKEERRKKRKRSRSSTKIKDAKKVRDSAAIINQRRRTYTCDPKNEGILKRVDDERYRDRFMHLFGNLSEDENDSMPGVMLAKIENRDKKKMNPCPVKNMEENSSSRNKNSLKPVEAAPRKEKKKKSSSSSDSSKHKKRKVPLSKQFVEETDSDCEYRLLKPQSPKRQISSGSEPAKPNDPQKLETPKKECKSNLTTSNQLSRETAKPDVPQKIETPKKECKSSVTVLNQLSREPAKPDVPQKIESPKKECKSSPTTLNQLSREPAKPDVPQKMETPKKECKSSPTISSQLSREPTKPADPQKLETPKKECKSSLTISNQLNREPAKPNDSQKMEPPKNECKSSPTTSNQLSGESAKPNDPQKLETPKECKSSPTISNQVSRETAKPEDPQKLGTPKKECKSSLTTSNQLSRETAKPDDPQKLDTPKKECKSKSATKSVNKETKIKDKTSRYDKNQSQSRSKEEPKKSYTVSAKHEAKHQSKKPLTDKPASTCTSSNKNENNKESKNKLNLNADGKKKDRSRKEYLKNKFSHKYKDSQSLCAREPEPSKDLKPLPTPAKLNESERRKSAPSQLSSSTTVSDIIKVPPIVYSSEATINVPQETCSSLVPPKHILRLQRYVRLQTVEDECVDKGYTCESPDARKDSKIVTQTQAENDVIEIRVPVPLVDLTEDEENRDSTPQQSLADHLFELKREILETGMYTEVSVVTLYTAEEDSGDLEVQAVSATVPLNRNNSQSSVDEPKCLNNNEKKDEDKANTSENIEESDVFSEEPTLSGKTNENSTSALSMPSLTYSNNAETADLHYLNGCLIDYSTINSTSLERNQVPQINFIMQKDADVTTNSTTSEKTTETANLGLGSSPSSNQATLQQNRVSSRSARINSNGEKSDNVTINSMLTEKATKPASGDCLINDSIRNQTTLQQNQLPKTLVANRSARKNSNGEKGDNVTLNSRLPEMTTKSASGDCLINYPISNQAPLQRNQLPTTQVANRSDRINSSGETSDNIIIKSMLTEKTSKPANACVGDCLINYPSNNQASLPRNQPPTVEVAQIKSIRQKDDNATINSTFEKTTNPADLGAGDCLINGPSSNQVTLQQNQLPQTQVAQIDLTRPKYVVTIDPQISEKTTKPANLSLGDSLMNYPSSSNQATSQQNRLPQTQVAQMDLMRQKYEVTINPPISEKAPNCRIGDCLINYPCSSDQATSQQNQLPQTQVAQIDLMRQKYDVTPNSIPEKTTKPANLRLDDCLINYPSSNRAPVQRHQLPAQVPQINTVRQRNDDITLKSILSDNTTKPANLSMDIGAVTYPSSNRALLQQNQLPTPQVINVPLNTNNERESRLSINNVPNRRPPQLITPANSSSLGENSQYNSMSGRPWCSLANTKSLPISNQEITPYRASSFASLPSPVAEGNFSTQLFLLSRESLMFPLSELSADKFNIILQVFIKHLYFLIHLLKAQNLYKEALNNKIYCPDFFKVELRRFENEIRTRVLEQATGLYNDLFVQADIGEIRAAQNLPKVVEYLIEKIVFTLNSINDLPKKVSKATVYLLLKRLTDPYSVQYTKTLLFKVLMDTIGYVTRKAGQKSNDPSLASTNIFSEEMRRTLESQIGIYNKSIMIRRTSVAKKNNLGKIIDVASPPNVYLRPGNNKNSNKESFGINQQSSSVSASNNRMCPPRTAVPLHKQLRTRSLPHTFVSPDNRLLQMAGGANTTNLGNTPRYLPSNDVINQTVYMNRLAPFNSYAGNNQQTLSTSRTPRQQRDYSTSSVTAPDRQRNEILLADLLKESTSQPLFGPSSSNVINESFVNRPLFPSQPTTSVTGVFPSASNTTNTLVTPQNQNVTAQTVTKPPTEIATSSITTYQPGGIRRSPSPFDKPAQTTAENISVKPQAPSPSSCATRGEHIQNAPQPKAPPASPRSLSVSKKINKSRKGNKSNKNQRAKKTSKRDAVEIVEILDSSDEENNENRYEETINKVVTNYTVSNAGLSDSQQKENQSLQTVPSVNYQETIYEIPGISPMVSNADLSDSQEKDNQSIETVEENRSPFVPENVTAKSPAAISTEAIETIDLTFIDDMDESEWQTEIDFVFVKHEHADDGGEPNTNEVRVASNDSGMSSPLPSQNEEISTYTAVRRFCICGEVAVYVCECEDMDTWYCGEECQERHWETHKLVCRAIMDEATD